MRDEPPPTFWLFTLGPLVFAALGILLWWALGGSTAPDGATHCFVLGNDLGPLLTSLTSLAIVPIFSIPFALVALLPPID